MNQSSIPDGDRIYDLYTGVYKPQIIRIALELDIFSALKSGPAKAEPIARACGCEPIGINHLLNYLASLNVLISDGDYYKLSSEAATFLVKGEKAYSGDLIMDFVGLAPWESLRNSIRTGKHQKIDLDIHFVQDAWIESYRSARISSSIDMWTKVGIAPGPSINVRLLDLACGCAIKSMVLVKGSPHVQLTCLDTSMVLAVTRDLAERWDLLPQVKFRADDLMTADLGESIYQVCLLGQITHYFTEQQNRDLFLRIYRALTPGGKLVLDVPMVPIKPDEATSFLSLLLWANSGGRAYKFEEYRVWLMDAGFTNVNQHSERLLSATR